MRSFQGNGVQGNRYGLGKQSLSLAKKRISRELQVRLPRGYKPLAMTICGFAMTIRSTLPLKIKERGFLRRFQGNGVQGNRYGKRDGLGKQSLSLAKKRIYCELQVRLPRRSAPCNDTVGFEQRLPRYALLR